MNRPRLIWVIVLCLLGIVPANGQSTTRPASAADQALEDQPLRIVGNDAKSGTTHAPGSDSALSGFTELSRILIALIVVVSVILLLRSGIRQMTAMPAAGRAGKPVTVLSRSHIAPRQQVLVMQVGNRLLVVGDSGGRMNSLCEITDPDEIATMIGQTRSSPDGSDPRPAGSFLKLFRRANEPFAEVDALQTTEDSDTQGHSEQTVSSEDVNGLMDKVRLLQEQFRAKA